MSLLSEGARPFQNLTLLGIAFRRYEDQSHVGLLVRHRGTPFICHLAQHRNLLFEPVTGPFVWDDCHFLDADPQSATAIAAFIVSLGTNPTNVRAISYGIRYPRRRVFNANGTVNHLHHGAGHTCATFVMEIFEHFGIELLNKGRWKGRVADRIWQRKIIKTIENAAKERQSVELQQHADALKKNVGAARYRPEEVASAAASVDIPLSFDEARSLGMQLVLHYKNEFA